MPLPKILKDILRTSSFVGGWKYTMMFLVLYLTAVGYKVNIMCTAIPNEFLIGVAIALCAAAIIGGIIMGAINWSNHIGDSGVRKKLAVKHVATAAIGTIIAMACGYVFAPVVVKWMYADAEIFEWVMITAIVTFLFAMFWVYIVQGGYSAIKNIGDAIVKTVEAVKDAGDKVFASLDEFRTWYESLSEKEKKAYNEAQAAKKEADAAAAAYAEAHPELVKVESAPEDGPKIEG